MNFNLDLRKPYEQEVRDAVLRVIDRNQFIFGEEIQKFEQAWASYNMQRFAVGVGNGTDAIRLALLALGVKPGDEVISPAFNVAYTAMAVQSIGAKNVFVDSVLDTMLVSAADISKAVTPKTRAIIPVHLYGAMVDVKEIRRRLPHLLIVEDAAQAHGSLNPEFPGHDSHAVAYSFYPTKNLGALGEAGAVTTNIPVVAERVRLMRDAGRTDRYVHVLPGWNSCLDEIQAAVLNVKLKWLPERNARREAIAYHYQRDLDGVGDIKFQEYHYGRTYHLFVIRTAYRNELHRYLAEAQIPTLIHYPLPVPSQPVFAADYMDQTFPIAEQLSREVLSLPIHPDLTSEEADEVINAVKTFFSF